MLDWMQNAERLSQAEVIWLLVWNIAAGNWDRIGLPTEKAAEFFLDVVSKLSGDPLTAAENSRVQLQRGLIASGAPVEEVRHEPPFNNRPRHNLERLLTAWKSEGKPGVDRAWQEIFSAPGNGDPDSASKKTALTEPAAYGGGLLDGELAWLIAWNAAAGVWERIGLSPDEAKRAFLHLLRSLQGDPLKAVKESLVWLRQSLMALGRESFEHIQSEAPFSRDAQRKFEAMVRAWQDEGEEGVTRVWKNIFAPGSQKTKRSQLPIKIFGGPGDSEERALEVIGAPDQETRVAAEHWYLYYTYGRGWKWLMHATVRGNEGGGHFSMHQIRILPDQPKRIYFRLPW